MDTRSGTGMIDHGVLGEGPLAAVEQWHQLGVAQFPVVGGELRPADFL